MNDQTPAYNSRITKIYLEYLKKHHPDIDLDSVLEAAGMSRHEVEDQAHWYSQEQVDRFYSIVAVQTGNPDIARLAGRYAASTEGIGFLKQHILGLMKTESIYLLMEKLYPTVSRGATVRVKKLGPRKIEIVATPTPGIHEKRFQCQNRMGQFESLAKLFTKQLAKIEHPECFHRGDSCCRYIVTWNKAPYLVLKSIRNYALLLGFVAAPFLFVGLDALPRGIAGLLYVFLIGGVSLLAAHVERRELVKTIQTQGDAAENALKEMRTRYDHAVLVQEIGKTISSISQVDRMLEAVVSVMEQHLDVRRVIVLLADPEGRRLRYASGCGLSKGQEDVLRDIEFLCDAASKEKLLSSTLEGKTFRSLADTVRAQPEVIARPDSRIADIRLEAFLCLAVVYRDEFVGALGLDTGRTRNLLTKTDLNVMRGISSQIASGIVNARSFQALKGSERNYRELVENARSIILRLDLQGKVTFVNEFSQSYLGYGYEEVIGKRLDETILFDREHRFDETVNALLRDPSRHISSETAIELRPGDPVWIAWTCLPILDKEGGVKEVLYVGNDITRLKRAEVESERARASSEAANRAKSEFLANMSHEIRTPMHGVLGMADLLQSTELNARQRRLIERLLSSGRGLLAIIDDILDFSSMEAGRLKMRSVPFGLRRTVEEVLETLAETAHRKGLELFCQVDRNLPDRYCGDPNRLRQILNNLVGNAVKFTEQGEVVVHVRPGENRENKTGVRFEVKDTGIGVPAELQLAIFEPFAQEDGSAARIQGGTGLGLTIVRRICAQMGGEIHLESVPGKGSTFWFELPLDEDSEQKTVEPPPSNTVSGARVLAVDDSETSRGLLQQQMAVWGVTCDVAENAEAALKKLSDVYDENESYDLALLDSEMPDMTGIQVAGAIRADPRVRELPMVLLNPIGSKVAEAEIKQAGLVAYLDKPVLESELFDCLHSILGEPCRDGIAAETTRKDAGLEYDARVLLVEDNPVNQELGVSMLEDLGCRVDVAWNGLEALEEVTKTRFDLVLMDCQMPRMDGYEATERIRNQEETAKEPGTRLPIIALTAHAMEGDRDKCLAAGMDDYLSKPFSQEQLAEVLGQWLTKVPARREGFLEVDNHDGRGSSGAEKEEPWLDSKALDTIRALQRKGKPDLLSRVVRIYLEDSLRLLETLRQAVSQRDAEMVKRHAHTLKSSSANVGAVRLSTLCKDLEKMDLEGASEKGSHILSKIETEYAGVRSALSREMEKGSP